MTSANNLRKGHVIKYQGHPHLVLDMHHRTPGNLRAFVQAKLRNLSNQRSTDVRFSTSENIEKLTTDRQTLEFSYVDRGSYSFMNTETYESIEISEELVGEAKHYLVPNSEVEILFVENSPIDITLPSSVVLKVTESADGIRGDTASNVQKPATLETGLVVQVPLFIKVDEEIRVSTADGSYMGRSKE
jgi:elongation factor P